MTEVRSGRSSSPAILQEGVLVSIDAGSRRVLHDILPSVQSFQEVGMVEGKTVRCCAFFCLLFLWPALALANVRISGFTDAGPDTWSGSGAVTWNDSLCVYNSAGDGFKVTATGSGTGGAFTLQGPQNLTYTVSFKSISLTAGSPQIFGSGAHRTLNDCGGTPNSPLEISISETNLSAAEPGEYQGTLTILLEPN